MQKERSDKQRAVYYIQNCLLALHNAGFPIPEVVPDGIYDHHTADAVSAFQALTGLPQTGCVDGRTWAAIRGKSEECMHACEKSTPIFPFEYNKRGTLKPEERSDLIFIIQVMLRTLVGQFSSIVDEEPNGLCDNTTKENIRYLQGVWNLAQTGEIDLDTWNMLAAAYNKYLNRE